LVVFAQNRPQEDRENRQRELWSSVKGALTSEGSQNYFEENLFYALLPPFKGTVVSRRTPAEKQETIVIARSDKKSPEVTLRFVREKPAQAK
jgi:hypothetical protein